MVGISPEGVAYPASFTPFDLVVDLDFIAAFPQVNFGYSFGSEYAVYMAKASAPEVNAR